MSDKWDKLNKEFDTKLNSMTKEDWEQFNQITMQQTPIELAIVELEKQNSVQYSRFTERNIEHLKSLIPYEKQHLRSVSEKAWDESYNAVCRTITGRDVEIDEENYEKAKQTYLNQKHPL